MTSSGSTNIIVPYNCPIRLILLYYAFMKLNSEQIMSLINGEEYVYFSYNQNRSKINDNTKVGKKFQNANLYKINVDILK